MSRGQLDTKLSCETGWLFRNRKTGQEDLDKNMTVHSSTSENTSAFAIHPDVGRGQLTLAPGVAAISTLLA